MTLELGSIFKDSLSMTSKEKNNPCLIGQQFHPKEKKVNLEKHILDMHNYK
jgi:hypothetical protein